MHTKQDYIRMFTQLLPPGDAWEASENSFLYNIFAGWAEECIRFEQRMLDLMDESDPRYTLELLPDFENDLGLPDQCFLTAEATIDQRRQEVVNILRNRQGLFSLPQIREVSAMFGFEVEVEEGIPSYFGGRFGSRFSPDESKYYITIRQISGNIIRARFGASHFGERFTKFDNELLYCVLLRPVIRADRAVTFIFTES
jgi:uncharacterized protein YmfQ (DUF2313 family)